MSVYSDHEVITVAKASKEHVRQSEGSILELRDGTFLIGWLQYGGDGHDEGRNALCLMNSPDGGRTWGCFRVFAEPGPDFRNIESISLIRAENGDILLFYRQIYTPKGGDGPDLAAGFLARSADEGASFGVPRTIWDKTPFYPASSSMRRLRNGRLYLPGEYHDGKFPIEDGSKDNWSKGEKIHLKPYYSDDDGETWIFCKDKLSLPMRGAMEPSVAELADGRLIMVMRNQLGSLFKSHSSDMGETWSKPQTTGLRIPESCPVVSNIPGSDKILFIWNNSEYDPFFDHCGVRYPLTAAISKDGVTFTDFWDIETDRRIYTNPGVSWTKDGVCLVNYWTCVYLSDGNWGPPDLRLSRFKVTA
jgi:sialidase-1